MPFLVLEPIVPFSSSATDQPRFWTPLRILHDHLKSLVSIYSRHTQIHVLDRVSYHPQRSLPLKCWFLFLTKKCNPQRNRYRAVYERLSRCKVATIDACVVGITPIYSFWEIHLSRCRANTPPPPFPSLVVRQKSAHMHARYGCYPFFLRDWRSLPSFVNQQSHVSFVLPYICRRA